MNATATTAADRSTWAMACRSPSTSAATRRGGPPILLLHGGAGPQSIAGLAAALSGHAYVVTPAHPGFDGTPRPPWLDSAADLADAYLDLLEALSLDAVMVIGNSIGGWIAAEMALRDIHGRIKSLVLLNANGIRPDNATQVTDIRGLAPAEIGRLSFHNPALRPDPAALSAGAARRAGRQPADPGGLRGRGLHVRAEAAPPPAPRHRAGAGRLGRGRPRRHGRLRPRLRAAFPNGHFQPIAEAGHLPQIEQPAAVLGAIADFARDVAGPGGA